MNGSCVLDTNIVIAIFAGEESVLTQLSAAEEIFVPSIVLGELYYGAHKSARMDSNVNRVDAFAETNVVLECDIVTAQEYGRIKNELRAMGRPIPENDFWIAAIAMQHKLTLVTRDFHFSNVNGLTTNAW